MADGGRFAPDMCGKKETRARTPGFPRNWRIWWLCPPARSTCRPIAQQSGSYVNGGHDLYAGVARKQKVTPLSTLNLTWIKLTNGDWPKLNTVNLGNVTTEGVYIIWHGGSNPRVVYVGQGAIADRLTAHRKNKDIQAYAAQTLYVTWASVAAAKRDGVENYLADQWNPLVGENHPDCQPIAVNSPWS